MEYSYTYKTGQNRTVKARDPTEPVKNVHASHCHSHSGLCTPTHLRSQGAHQVDVVLQVNRDGWQARKGNTAPNCPHNKMRAAEPRAGIGGVEQEEPEAELFEVSDDLE